MLHTIVSAPFDSQSLPVSKKTPKQPRAWFVSLYPGGEIPGSEEEVQAAASGERSQASQDGRGGTETSQPGQDCCCRCAVGCGSRSDPLPSAGRAHVMCCRGKLANSRFLCKPKKNNNKQTVRRADGTTRRPDAPSAPAQHSRSLCCVTHLSVNKAASVRHCVSAEDPGGQCCQSRQMLFMPGRVQVSGSAENTGGQRAYGFT